MDPAVHLVHLCHGTRLLEDHNFLDIANFTDLPDFAQIDFYRLNNLLQSTLIRDGPWGSMSKFLDYALQPVGPPSLLAR